MAAAEQSSGTQRPGGFRQISIKKHQGKELPLYAGRQKLLSYTRVNGKFLVRPINGLMPVAWWSSPPDKHPKAFVLFPEEEMQVWPLWDPDDLVDWVPLDAVERSASEVARGIRERVRPEPIGRKAGGESPKNRSGAASERPRPVASQAERRLVSDLAGRVTPDSGHGRASVAYAGSDAALTRRTLRDLEDRGQPGRIAAALFRAQKASSRAKRYRGGPDRGSASYSELAYARKGVALSSLSWTLIEDGAGMVWGWGTDDDAEFAVHVLYVDIPTGQVSFHSLDRFDGPDYPGSWDGVKDVSAARILLWCDQLLAG
jgi:hypothetical protein